MWEQELLVNQYLEYMPSRADMELNVQGLSADGKKNLEYIIENGKTNVATSIATPVAGLFMVLILWKDELFAGVQTPRVLQILMTICYVFAVFMTVNALRTHIPNLINSFIGG